VYYYGVAGGLFTIDLNFPILPILSNEYDYSGRRKSDVV
jgi:hypothetical protein